MTYETTDAHFNQFCTYCRKWQEKLGLLDWHIYYFHDTLGDEPAMAECRLDSLVGRVASIALGKEWPVNPTDEKLNDTAAHEILHLCFADLIDVVEDLHEDAPKTVKQTMRVTAVHGIINRLIPILLKGAGI